MDRNILLAPSITLLIMSLSARRAWIEIETLSSVVSCPLVALRKESVDRNGYAFFWWRGLFGSLSARRAWIEILTSIIINQGYIVALRKESVDRNSIALASMRVSIVALRKESVDRNMLCTSVCFVCVGSLSARRAWIEICID